MSWVFTSKRYKGQVGSPPRTEFAIGNIVIASIIMRQPEATWRFELIITGEEQGVEYTSFARCMKELHRRLNSPAPEGFEV